MTAYRPRPNFSIAEAMLENRLQLVNHCLLCATTKNTFFIVQYFCILCGCKFGLFEEKLKCPN